MRQDNLKKRLAYSTVSQLSYVILAAALFTPGAAIGAAMHIAAHAVSKITLFFAAGAIYTAAHKTEISELNGIPLAEQYFGEDQGRYVVTIDRDHLEAVQEQAQAAGLFAPWIGVTGGAALKLGNARPIPVEELRAAHDSWVPRFMDGPDATVL